MPSRSCGSVACALCTENCQVSTIDGINPRVGASSRSSNSPISFIGVSEIFTEYTGATIAMQMLPRLLLTSGKFNIVVSEIIFLRRLYNLRL